MKVLDWRFIEGMVCGVPTIEQVRVEALILDIGWCEFDAARQAINIDGYWYALMDLAHRWVSWLVVDDEA